MWMEKIQGDNAPPPQTAISPGGKSSTVGELERVLVLVKELGLDVANRESESLVGEISTRLMKAIAGLKADEKEKEEKEETRGLMAPVGSPVCSVVRKNEIDSTSEMKKKKKTKKKKKHCKTLGTEEMKAVHRRRSHPYMSTKTSSSLEDGYTWRKYGQKTIQSSKHPRSYYRCTHKHARGCQATRQTQKSDDDDTTYHLTYIGHHTCRDASLEHQPTGGRGGGTGYSTGFTQTRLISFGPPPQETPAAAPQPSPQAAPTKKECVEQDVVSGLTHEHPALSELTPLANTSIPIITDVLSEFGDVTSGFVYTENLMEEPFDFAEMCSLDH